VVALVRRARDIPRRGIARELRQQRLLLAVRRVQQYDRRPALLRLPLLLLR
jgi:hypothetical protein